MKKILLSLVFLALSFGADISVNNAYARASIGHAPNSAVFLTIENKGDKAVSLKAVKSSPELCKEAQIHTNIREDGMMKMKKLDELKIEPKSSKELRPGGDHIMLIELSKALKEGDKISLILEFDDNSTLSLDEIQVKNIANAHAHH